MISDAERRENLDDYEACERGEFVLSTLAFTVATKMVRSGDSEILGGLPVKLREAVWNMARVYERDGELVSQSSVGMFCHNELGAALAKLLPPSGLYAEPPRPSSKGPPE